MKQTTTQLGRTLFVKMLGKNRVKLRTFSVLALLSLALVGLSTTQAGVPRGVFSLSNGAGTINPAVLANPDVDGVSLRDSWADIEPSDGTYNFAYLDKAVAACATAGKKVLLRIATMAKRPTWVDAEVEEAGGEFFTWDNSGVETTIPVFWDPTFLAKKIAMIQALGAHFGNNPAVTIVATSFANACSEDWSIPSTSDLVPQWISLGYSSDKMLAAGQQIVDATMTAFPTQYVTMAMGSDVIAIDGGMCTLATDIQAEELAKWPGRLLAEKNSLSTYSAVAPATFNTIWRLISDSQPLGAVQMLNRCVNDPTYQVNAGVPIDPTTELTESVNNGLTYNPNFIEIYQADVVALPSVIAYAHSALMEPTGQAKTPHQGKKH